MAKTQEKQVSTEVKNLQGDQKVLLNILLECIQIKNPEKEILHIFPEAYIQEDTEKITVGTYYYGKDYYPENNYSASMATYYAYLSFEKEKPRPKGIYGTSTPHTEKATPTYGYGVRDMTKNKSYYSSYDYVLTKKSDKPVFKNEFEKISYYSSISHNKVDPKIYPQKYENVIFVNKSIIIGAKNGKFGAESSDKKLVLPFDYEYIHVFGKDFLVKKDSKYFFVNSNNEKISDVFEEFSYPLQYSFLVRSSEEFRNIFPVKINGKATFIDKNYRVLKPLLYDKLQFLKAKPLQLLADTDHKQVIIDYHSFKEISPRFEKIGRFDEENFLIENNGKKGIADPNFKFILECIYDKIEFVAGIHIQQPETWKLSLEKDKKFAAFNFAKKTFITKFDYDEINIEDNYIKVKKDGKFGILDLNGKIITPIKFDFIYWNKKNNRTEASKKGEIFKVSDEGKIINN